MSDDGHTLRAFDEHGNIRVYKTELRVAEDGTAYSYPAFITHFGPRFGQLHWDKADRDVNDDDDTGMLVEVVSGKGRGNGFDRVEVDKADH